MIRQICRATPEGAVSASCLEKIRLCLRAFHADVLFGFLARRMSGRIRITSRPVMVIAPHQDDETFGCGGLIALKRQQGIEVRVVFLTDGGNSPLPAEGSIERGDLAGTRIREALAALSALGVSEANVHFLGFPDSELKTMPADQREEIIEQLRALLLTHQAHEVLVPHGEDGHGDHEAGYLFVIEAIRRSGLKVRLQQYAIWRPWLHPLYRWSCLRELSSASLLSIEPVLREKHAAIDAYASQLATLPPGFIRRFRRPYEVYFASGEASAVGQELPAKVVLSRAISL